MKNMISRVIQNLWFLKDQLNQLEILVNIIDSQQHKSYKNFNLLLRNKNNLNKAL